MDNIYIAHMYEECTIANYSLTLQITSPDVWLISESSWITWRRVPVNPTNTATKISELSR